MNGTTTVSRRYSLDECRVVVRQLWPYLDGALPDRDRDLVAQHVADCSLCEPHFAFARSFLHAVQLAHGTAPDFAALRTRVVAALAAQGFERPELT